MYDITSIGDRFYISYRAKEGSLPHVALSEYNGTKWHSTRLSAANMGYPQTIYVHPLYPNMMYAG
ncbi:hypothetical protein ACFL67_04115, partial [candidate division KSB1 bacterium]